MPGWRANWRITGFAAACVLLAAGGGAFLWHIIDSKFEATSASEAGMVADMVQSELPDAARLIGGDGSAIRLRGTLDDSASPSRIRGVRLYDNRGHLIASGMTPADLAPVASARGVAADPPSFPVLTADRIMHDPVFDIVTIRRPLSDGGRCIGWLEVDVDNHVISGHAKAAEWLALLAYLVALGGAALIGCTLLDGERRSAARRLTASREHDPLTGLPNANALMTLIARWFAEAPRGGNPAALILCEIGDLAGIAETLGAPAADSAIVQSAQRLADLNALGCKLAVAAPGRFALFWPSVTDTMDVLTLVKQVTTHLSRPFIGPASAVTPSVRAGIALSGADASNAEMLLQSAEMALRGTREQPVPAYGFFNPEIAKDAKRRSAIQRAIGDALANETFRLEFQPIYEIRSGELTCFEALLRLTDPDLGFISPAEFIPIAEQTGQIVRLGAWVLQEACRVAADWPAHLFVSVNLSPEQFYSGSVIAAVRDALTRNRLPSYRLQVEITEGTLLKGSDLVLQQLGLLRDMGVAVALDDFGTGYSSLSYLWKFPFSGLKIDRSFVTALDGGQPTARSMLRTIIKLSHGLGLTVTAEGIETQEQFTALKDLRCDHAQGYLLDRPARIEDLAAIILRNFAKGLQRPGEAKSRAREMPPLPRPAGRRGRPD